MVTIRKILAQKLPPDIRIRFLERCQYMESQLEYFEGRGDERIRRFQQRGWPLQKLQVTLVLNAFYQAVLAPLASSARPTDASPIAQIDILYGNTFAFDSDWRTSINAAHSAFTNMASQFGIPKILLMQQRTEDVLYRINRMLNENERS